MCQINYPPVSKASREVANLTERKNPHNPVYGGKELILILFGLYNVANFGFWRIEPKVAF